MSCMVIVGYCANITHVYDFHKVYLNSLDVIISIILEFNAELFMKYFSFIDDIELSKLLLNFALLYLKLYG